MSMNDQQRIDEFSLAAHRLVVQRLRSHPEHLAEAREVIGMDHLERRIRQRDAGQHFVETLVAWARRRAEEAAA